MKALDDDLERRSRVRSPFLTGLSLVGLWLIPGLLQCVQEVTWARAKGGDASTAHILLHFLPTWLPWALFTPLVLALAKRFPLRGSQRWTSVVVHVVGCVVFGGAHLWILGLVRTSFPPSEWATRELSVWMTNALWTLQTQAEVLAYAGVVLASMVQDSLRKAREREVRSVRLESQLSESRLAALRNQLQPHFLFNTLNAIDVLLVEDPATARKMLHRLSDLLRRTLETDVARHDLALELEHLRSYVDIERVRFSDRLAFEVDVAPELMGCAVPSLLLQPLAENAVRHGIAPRATGGKLRVSARRVDAWLELCVEDDGVGLGSFEREGIGLTNTRQRLRALYGSDQQLDLAEGEGGGVRVQVRVPLQLQATSMAPEPTTNGHEKGGQGKG